MNQCFFICKTTNKSHKLFPFTLNKTPTAFFWHLQFFLPRYICNICYILRVFWELRGGLRNRNLSPPTSRITMSMCSSLGQRVIKLDLVVWTTLARLFCQHCDYQVGPSQSGRIIQPASFFGEPGHPQMRSVSFCSEILCVRLRFVWVSAFKAAPPLFPHWPALRRQLWRESSIPLFKSLLWSGQNEYNKMKYAYY